MVGITITPKKALVDDVIKIVVKDLRPFQHTTLVCRIDVDGKRFCSTALYKSDSNGVVDVTTASATKGGTYEGVEPMGLIWSMVAEPGQKPGLRIITLGVTKPMDTHVYALDKEVTPPAKCLEQVEQGRWLAKSSCTRSYMASGVQRLEVRHGRLMGTLFVPPGNTLCPGVIDLFGTIGGVVEHRSALLASRGIVSLTLSYFSPDGSENNIFTNDEDMDLGYFEEAADFLLAHPRVNKPHVGIIGVSFGAFLALIFSSWCPKVRACVEINGTLVAMGTSFRYKDKHLPCADFDFSQIESTDEGLVVKHVMNRLHHEEFDKYTPELESTTCDYLLVHGEDDQNVGKDTGEYIFKQFKKTNLTNYRLLMYPGAGHLIEPPYSPLCRASYNPVLRGICLWGGRPKEHNDAQEDAWRQVLHLFKSKLTPHSQL